VADPVPLDGLTVNQAALLVAVHVASFGETVRLIVLLPAVAGTAVVAVERAYVGVTPLCVTVKFFPPIVNVPVRLLMLLLAATE
jgi:hypothetical protein